MGTLLIPAFSLKTCNRCSLIKNLQDFSVNKARPDGYSDRCKECDKEYQATRRASDREGQAKYHRNYRKKRKEESFEYRLRSLLYASQARARDKNREHTLTMEDLLEMYPEDGLCPVFGFPLEFNSGGFRETSPSIDRIDSSRGYTRDNVQIISWKANRIKSSATADELETVAAFLKRGGN